MLTAVPLDLACRRGQTFRKLLEYFEPDNTTPIPMDGWRALMHIRDKVGGVLYHELSTENGGITLDPTSGAINLYIPDEETENFAWKVGVYDLKFFYPSGDDDYLCYGKFKMTARVTEEP